MEQDDSKPLFDSDDLPHDDDQLTARKALAPVLTSLQEAGYYAYGMLNENNEWIIAADDEVGKIDIRVGSDGFEVILSMSSPGMFADEESPWKQASLARLARISLPRVIRGFLEPHQAAIWDEVEQGISVSEHYELPFTRANDIGQFVREQHPAVEDLLILVERQLR